MRIGNRLAIGLLVGASVAAASAVVTALAYQASSRFTNERAQSLLRSELDGRRLGVESYLDGVAESLRLLASTQTVLRYLIDLTQAFSELGPEARAHLQRFYVAENPYPLGRKQTLLAASDGSSYSRLHAEVHKLFRKLAEARDYYDIFLISARGDVIYSVFKETDFAANVTREPLRDTGLGKVFVRLRKDPRPQSVILEDFAPYQPSHGLPAAFLGTPLVSEGVLVGALVVQLKPDQLDPLMRFSSVMGESGEAYLVGPDYLMRSRSRFRDQSTALEQRVETPTVTAALSNTSGIGRIVGYRGVPVLSAYAPLTRFGVTWAAVAEIEAAEVSRHANDLLLRLALASALLTLLGFLLGYGLGAEDTEG